MARELLEWQPLLPSASPLSEQEMTGPCCPAPPAPHGFLPEDADGPVLHLPRGHLAAASQTCFPCLEEKRGAGSRSRCVSSCPGWGRPQSTVQGGSPLCGVRVSALCYLGPYRAPPRKSGPLRWDSWDLIAILTQFQPWESQSPPHGLWDEGSGKCWTGSGCQPVPLRSP